METTLTGLRAGALGAGVMVDGLLLDVVVGEVTAAVVFKARRGEAVKAMVNVDKNERLNAVKTRETLMCMIHCHRPHCQLIRFWLDGYQRLFSLCDCVVV